MNKRLIIKGFSAVLVLASCNSSQVHLGQSDIQQVIDSLTIEEKLHLVIGDAFDTKSNGEAVIGSTQKIVPGAAGNTYAIERLGITPAILADGPAGVRIDSKRKNDKKTYYCTHFPIGTLLASTWNTELVTKVGEAIGNEAKEYGVDVLLAPAINIHRNPLCGRNFEYYSEDPLIAGKIGAAYIKGVQSNGIGTSLKHFALNNQETNRQGVDVRVSQRAIREIYLKGFEIAIKEAQPWTVMSSYNMINGTYSSQSYDLLTKILREEWGFKGMVMTDWYGGKDAVEQMKAGNDLLMPGRLAQYTQLKDAIELGTIDMSIINTNIQRILQMVKLTPRFQGYKYSNHPDLQAHAKVTRQSAEEGMILLKNNGMLPLQNANNIALFGNTSYDFIAGGSGSGNVNRAYTVSLLDGIKNAKLSADSNLQQVYEKYITQAKKAIPRPTGPFARFLSAPLPSEKTFNDTELEAYAEHNDAAIITIGRLSGEFVDRNEKDFNLSNEEKNLIEKVCSAFHAKNKRVVVVLNIGGVIETKSWKELPDAILLAWQAGQEGGNSVIDILTGKACPSGKLTMTFPINLSDHASSNNFPKDGKMIAFDVKGTENKNKQAIKDIDYVDYAEDIYVGYRYFDTFHKNVSYPFGYGLSYTHFVYNNPQVTKTKNEIEVKVEVKNVGKVAGKEVVELYASAPSTARLCKPSKELRAFGKTQTIQPGESETIILKFSQKDLASFNEKKSGWKVDAGNYQLLLGNSSQNILQTLEVKVDASFTPVENVLNCQSKITTLHP